MAFFTIGFISVSRTSCLILFNEGGTPDFPLNGAVLWNDNQQSLPSSEFILRSMWLSLATKAMEEKWQVSVSTDSAGLATEITVLRSSTSPTGSSISLPVNKQQREELVQQLLNQHK